MEKNSAVAESRAAGKALTELTAQLSAAAQKQFPAEAAVEAPSVFRSVSALITVAALPQDALSESIILFARFFSLPLTQGTLTAIRRQSIQAPADYPAEKTALAETIIKSREALALAAAAAGSKGVELSPESLEIYAAAIEPRGRERENPGERRGRGRDKKEPDNEKTAPAETVHAACNVTKKTILAAAGKDPLLDILNRLPEKNGRRWMVFPFNFNDGGKTFSASLKILLEKEESAKMGNSGLMCLDIAEGSVENAGVKNDGAERSWLFVLKQGRLTVYINPPPRLPEPFIRQLSQAAGIPVDRITVRQLRESFPFEQEQGSNLLRSINKTV